MIVYADSSVLLRLVLGQTDALAEWKQVGVAISSALAEVECLRTLDRLRLADDLSDEVLAARRQAIYDLIESIELAALTSSVLARAAQPFPTALRTLDAIHLATALLWKEHRGADLVMATHDRALAIGARAMGLQVVGA
ncbi:MAG TPA: type II toxin-antitoxin system VapC family toxin [Casimicrobiaceae bacterium]|nr:type II toxin-antitoxin system VapC family toxin [Casimicrobiaceae bacterium]